MNKSQYDWLLKEMEKKKNYNPFDEKQNPQAKELKEACNWLKEH